VSEPAARPPLLLFDGVCNLCHGAVQWILARDRKQVFRFASLQSQVGREALAEAGYLGPIPESVIVIDQGQVFVAGDATLRIAKRLGGIWSVAAVLRVIPRSLRDGVYHWIARNRYRWFGKKEACPMPTPETLSRFLDADEPPPESWEIPSKPAEFVPLAKALPYADARGKLETWASWGARLSFIYWLLYIFPFPLNLIPETESWWAEYTMMHRNMLAWFGDVFFGLELTVFELGSGDTTSNYVEVVMRLAIAAVGGLLWHFAVGRRPVSGRTVEWIYLTLRFYLVSTLMVYGWIKVFPAQMPPPGPDRLMQPIGDASPMGLAWTFIGASPAYQAFSGAAELLAGFLLIFRRTALLGAMMSFGVMLNVAALNYFYDVPVKLFSTHLVVLSFMLMLPDLARLGALFFFQLPTQPRKLNPYPWQRSWQRLLGFLVLIGFLYQAVWPAMKGGWEGAHKYGALAEPGPMHGLYAVEAFHWGEASDREIEDDKRWVRLGVNHRGGSPESFSLAVARADGSVTRGWGEYNDELNEMTINPPIGGLSEFVIEQADDTGMVLWTEVDEQEVRIHLTREPEDSFELTRRGFHWIHEYPRNR
jgi:predicted DCC family thiol-disulfide oxidoreductase YuxK